MDIVYSIGHSNHETARFIELLKTWQVDLILDVRSQPYSQRYPQSNREELQHTLPQSGIAYQFFGLWFGARQTDERFYTAAGWLDYARFSASDIFNEGSRQLDIHLSQGKIPALMCSEKDPFDCHRAIMVGRALSLMGYEIRHILADGGMETQAELDLRLLDKYFPRRDEGSIFDLIEGEADPAKQLADAYLKRNEAIAWRPESLEN